jgi:hypothetical protein
MKFEELEFERTFDGKQAIVKFPNGYEVSVVRNGLSYGGKKGFYEIGVFDSLGRMRDPLGWGDTVKGWLLPSDVTEEMQLIKSL